MCFRRRRKGKGNRKGEDHVDTWEHNQHSFVSLEEKDKFGDFESFYQPTYPGILITTEHYNYDFRNTWNSSLSSNLNQLEFVSLIFLLIPFIWWLADWCLSMQCIGCPKNWYFPFWWYSVNLLNLNKIYIPLKTTLITLWNHIMQLLLLKPIQTWICIHFEKLLV